MKENKSKIFEISSYPPPHLGWGVRVRLLRERLLEKNQSCVVLNLGENRKVKSDEYEDVQNGLDFLRKIFRYLRNGYLIHMHTNGDSPKGFVLTLCVEIASIIFARRCVLTFHAGSEQIYFPKKNSKLLSPIFYLIFSLSKIIICNSKDVKEKIVEYGIYEDKIVPIPAFSKQYLQFEEIDLPADLTDFLNKHQKVITTSVRFDPRYYVDVLLKAFAMARAHQPGLGLILTGPTEGSEEFNELIVALGIADAVCVVGDLNHHAFLTLFKRSILYVRTPTTDGVSSSVLEALSLGLPVIASDNGTRPASVMTYLAEDADALYRTIRHVLDHYDEVKAAIETPELRDTVEEEVRLLIHAFYAREKHALDASPDSAFNSQKL